MIIEDYFFANIPINAKNQNLLQKLKNIALKSKQQIYVIGTPLADRKYQYDYSDAMIIVSSKKKIVFVDYGDNNDLFSDFYEDVIEDIASLSDRFGYKNKSVIGRPRDWKDALTQCCCISQIKNVDEWYNEEIVLPRDLYRKQDLLISLFIGSINDVKNIDNIEPVDLLEKVKHKIQLFDGQQTRFIYEELRTEGKRINIQGLSGTGKTELLLHKLKELYVNNPDATIGFTCFNKILSNNLKARIPVFFNFMKVEQQIDWNRLLCVNAWGRYNSPKSGIYRYICDYYDIPFYSYKECPSFERVCKLAIEQVSKKKKDKGYAFTYLFIDESQDFQNAFFDLCELTTEKKIFVAGDIFQSIFEERPKDAQPPNILLSKCYRTDPKTLMFAQALGMGLFEKKKLWWLDDQEWELCGYNILSKGENYTLTREPLRRFEDIDAKFNSLMIIRTDDVKQEIVKQIQMLSEEFPSLTPGDIAIIFLDNQPYIYTCSTQLQYALTEKIGWDCNIAYETKNPSTDQILISNRNNVKGLEYPFVFCLTTKITSAPSYRNTMYTMLTRSFIRSYLLVPKGSDAGLTSEILWGGRQIMNDGYMTVKKPSVSEIDNIKASIKSQFKALSLEDRMEQLFTEMHIEDKTVKELCKETILKLPDYVSDEKLKTLISSISSTFEV